MLSNILLDTLWSRTSVSQQNCLAGAIWQFREGKQLETVSQRIRGGTRATDSGD